MVAFIHVGPYTAPIVACHPTGSIETTQGSAAFPERAGDGLVSHPQINSKAQASLFQAPVQSRTRAMIDCHSHFYAPQFTKGELPELAAAAQAVGVQAIVVVPESLEDCQQVHESA